MGLKPRLAVLPSASVHSSSRWDNRNAWALGLSGFQVKKAPATADAACLSIASVAWGAEFANKIYFLFGEHEHFLGDSRVGQCSCFYGGKLRCLDGIERGILGGPVLDSLGKMQLSFDAKQELNVFLLLHKQTLFDVKA